MATAYITLDGWSHSQSTNNDANRLCGTWKNDTGAAVTLSSITIWCGTGSGKFKNISTTGAGNSLTSRLKVTGTGTTQYSSSLTVSNVVASDGEYIADLTKLTQKNFTFTPFSVANGTTISIYFEVTNATSDRIICASCSSWAAGSNRKPYVTYNNTVTLSFNVNGGSGSVNSITAIVGSSVTLPTGPSHANATSSSTFTITGNINGGSGSNKTKTVTKSGTAAVSFNGWATSSSATSGVTGNITCPSSNTTYYATWSTGSYSYTYSPATLGAFNWSNPTKATTSGTAFTITANGNGGTPSPQTKSPIPKNDYTFNCWNSQANGNGTNYTSSTTAATLEALSNKTIYAKYNQGTTYYSPINTLASFTHPTKSSTVISFNITCNPHNGGTTWTVSRTATTPYNFNIWASATSGGTTYPDSQAFTSDKTVYAQYTTGTTTYSTAARPDAQTWANTITHFNIIGNANYTGGANTSVTATKTTAHAWNGWYDATSGGNAVPDPMTYTAATTIHGQWTNTDTYTNNTVGNIPYIDRPNTVENYATITLNYNYTDSPDPFTITTTKTRTYTQTGWTATANGSTLLDSSTTYTTETTVYAKWTSSLGTTTSIYFPTPSRSGYNCLGWATSANATTPTYQCGTSFTPTTTSYTFYAVWEELAYFNFTKIYVGSQMVKNLYIGSNAVHSINLAKIDADTTYTIEYNLNGRTDVIKKSNQTKHYNESIIIDNYYPDGILEASPETVQLTIELNGGAINVSDPGNPHGYITLTRIFDVTQTSWNTTPSGSSGTSYSAGDTYSTNADLILYARYNQTSASAAYSVVLPTISPSKLASSWTSRTITCNRNGGTFTTSPCGSFTGTGTTGTRTVTYRFKNGYPLSAWWTTNGSDGVVVSDSTADQIVNDTIFAHYSITADPDLRNYDLAFVVLPNASHCTRTNYTLAGWATSSGATKPTYLPGQQIALTKDWPGTVNKTLYAVWSNEVSS